MKLLMTAEHFTIADFWVGQNSRMLHLFANFCTKWVINMWITMAILNRLAQKITNITTSKEKELAVKSSGKILTLKMVQKLSGKIKKIILHKKLTSKCGGFFFLTNIYIYIYIIFAEIFKKFFKRLR